jgi:hypothetical protein
MLFYVNFSGRIHLGVSAVTRTARDRVLQR